jgi:hypothetical protein
MDEALRNSLKIQAEIMLKNIQELVLQYNTLIDQIKGEK